MTRAEKVKKAVAIAVAYYIEQKNANMNKQSHNEIWGRSGVEMTMTKTKLMQKRGRNLRSA
jgi:hypothetical protein